MTMRAITLWQPWASLISIGVKPFETRDYPPPRVMLGQRIAIHAAVKHAGKMQAEMMRGPHWDVAVAISHALEEAGHRGNWGDLPHGAVVCTAVLENAYQCGPMDDDGQVFIQRCASGKSIGGVPTFFQSDPFGDYSLDRWAWRLTDVQVLARPIPARGKQGWWEFDPGEHNLTACGGCGRLLLPEGIAFRYAGGDTEMCASCAPTPDEAEAERAECRATKGDDCDLRGDCGSERICYPGEDVHG